LVGLVMDQGTDAWYSRTAEDLLKGLNAHCANCGEAKFRKETDILDVWFDSGVSWHSVVEQYFNAPKPESVLYLEGSDQHRGWFQTSLIPAVAVRERAPYNVVLTHGFVVDGKGHKMSKSLGNVIAPQEIVKKYGADILRLWVAMSDYRDDVRLSQDILNHVIDMYRRFRNTFRFFLQNTADFNVEQNAVPYEKMEEIDRWILSHFEEVKGRVLKAYDAYEFHTVLAELNRFAAVPLSGFYLDALKDRLYCEAPNSARRRSTQTALAHLARGMSVLLAPLLSFTAEECFLELRKVSWPSLPDSVLLDVFKSLQTFGNEAQLNEKYLAILELRGQVNDVLDKERKAGVLKSSQEAALSLNSSALSESQRKLLSHQEDWSFFFQMAEVTVGQSGDAVSIKASSSPKCERCWRHRSEVGKDATHPTLCARCLSVVAEAVTS
jgi:isoleucyl-tRNA synthetase